MSPRDALATLASIPTAGRLFREARVEQLEFAALEARADRIAEEAKATGEDKAEEVSRLYSEAEGHQTAARFLAGSGLVCVVATVLLPLWLGLSALGSRTELEDRAESWAAYAETPGLDAVPLADARRREAVARSAAERRSPWLAFVGTYAAAELVCAALSLAVVRRRP